VTNNNNNKDVIVYAIEIYIFLRLSQLHFRVWFSL